MEDLKPLFDQAVALVASGSFNASDEDKLRLYGFFKQATVGKCNTSRPGFFDFVGKAKWSVALLPIHASTLDFRLFSLKSA
jgi:acyl-CoA-binding protein